jgi:hypothetical protein
MVARVQTNLFMGQRFSLTGALGCRPAETIAAWNFPILTEEGNFHQSDIFVARSSQTVLIAILPRVDIISRSLPTWAMDDTGGSTCCSLVRVESAYQFSWYAYADALH